MKKLEAGAEMGSGPGGRLEQRDICGQLAVNLMEFVSLHC